MFPVFLACTPPDDDVLLREPGPTLIVHTQLENIIDNIRDVNQAAKVCMDAEYQQMYVFQVHFTWISLSAMQVDAVVEVSEKQLKPRTADRAKPDEVDEVIKRLLAAAKPRAKNRVAALASVLEWSGSRHRLGVSV